MKYLAFILLLAGCTTIDAQDGSELAKEREFEELVKKTSSNLDFSLSIQAEATEKQTQIVEQTVNKITTLKEEVGDLKTELNEVKATLDSVSNDFGDTISILPISHYKKN